MQHKKSAKRKSAQEVKTGPASCSDLHGLFARHRRDVDDVAIALQ